MLVQKRNELRLQVLEDGGRKPPGVQRSGFLARQFEEVSRFIWVPGTPAPPFDAVGFNARLRLRFLVFADREPEMWDPQSGGIATRLKRVW